MGAIKGTITVTKYIPFTGSPAQDYEQYENALFSAMSDLVDKMGYRLEMRSDASLVKGEVWLELKAKKKDDPR